MYQLTINVEVFRWDPDEGDTDILNNWTKNVKPVFYFELDMIEYIKKTFKIENLKFEDNVIKIEEVEQEGPEYELYVYSLDIFEIEINIKNVTEQMKNKLIKNE